MKNSIKYKVKLTKKQSDYIISKAPKVGKFAVIADPRVFLGYMNFSVINKTTFDKIHKILKKYSPKLEKIGVKTT